MIIILHKRSEVKAESNAASMAVCRANNFSKKTKKEPIGRVVCTLKMSNKIRTRTVKYKQKTSPYVPYDEGEGARLGFSNSSCGEVAFSTRGLNFWVTPTLRRGLLGRPTGRPVMIRGGEGNSPIEEISEDVSASGLFRGGLPLVELIVRLVPTEVSFLCVRSAKRNDVRPSSQKPNTMTDHTHVQ